MPKPVMNGKLAVRTYFFVSSGRHIEGNFFPKLAVASDPRRGREPKRSPFDFAVMKIVETENVDTHKRAMRQEVYCYAQAAAEAQAIATGLQVTIGTDPDPEDDEKKEEDYADASEFNLAPPGWGEIEPEDADEDKNRADAAWCPSPDEVRARLQRQPSCTPSATCSPEHMDHIRTDACS